MEAWKGKETKHGRIVFIERKVKIGREGKEGDRGGN